MAKFSAVWEKIEETPWRGSLGGDCENGDGRENGSWAENRNGRQACLWDAFFPAASGQVSHVGVATDGGC